jgi:hypothetical protein
MIDQAKWLENNDRHLHATVAWLRLCLENLASVSRVDTGKQQEISESAQGWFKHKISDDTKLLTPPGTAAIDKKIERVRQEINKYETDELSPALVLLVKHLGLSKFDSHVLALCAAMELDTSIATLCANAQQSSSKTYPTFALAFSLFDDPDWNTLSPHAPLRYWRLLEINQPGSVPLTSASLSVDERIINYLKGINYLDDRLTPLLDSIAMQTRVDALPLSQQQAADKITERLKYANGIDKTPVIELLGHDSASKQLIAAAVASELGLNLKFISSNAIPKQTGDFETFTRLWQRESLLMPLALYVDIQGSEKEEKSQLKRFSQRCDGVVFVDLNDSKTEIARNRLSIEVSKPTPSEQQEIWTQALQGHALQKTQHLVEQFSFNQNEINRIAHSILNDPAKKNSDEENSAMSPGLDSQIWQACRLTARVGMEQLAKRIDVKSNWDQLVLPREQKTLLQQITNQVAQRNRVYEDWGFRDRMNRGLGINALFTGASGTGKTMAAEVMANSLGLDLYRIDLSTVVSKYIGETEKNLSKLFDGAEDSGAILFFDEADALFGKRSEVKDSHDRYANIEINYLLQRLESYKGLAILATNMKSALDKAFVRRLRFIVDFPFPDPAQRQEIWEKVFPVHAPLDESLDYQRLAELGLTGGNIHNVAMNAAFLAAQEKSKITMPLILSAARVEYRKLERPAKESNFHWLDARQA